MGFTVDIDTGGTFTDGLFSDGKETKRVKVDTTPHDLTVSWIDCLRAGAGQFGFSTIRDFLEQVDIMRWSTTVATNVIAEGKGPKLGLFVTDGYRKSLYSPAEKSPVFGTLLEEANVEAVEFPLDTDRLLIQLKQLLEKGVRRICISLKEGLDHDEEVKIKEIFEDQYPDHYLGNVPLLLGRDICKHHDDMTRTHMGLMNSYVHGPMALAMFKAEDELRERGFMNPLLVGHINGGVARVSKTKPVDTIESGPIFGIHASAYWAQLYQLPYVVTLDVGGTTSKIGLVENFRPSFTREPDILGIPLKQTMLELRSIALGGGSVAKTNGAGLKLGPKSMGAYPGPACYDLGGGEATLTDAYLVKGFLDPTYFAGGTKKINDARAEKIIRERVAGPLGSEAQLAAYQIADLATTMVTAEVTALIKERGRPPKEYALFAFGGNGAIVGCEVAKKAGINKVYFFNQGSVLSAFGSSVADVSHTYEFSPFVKATETESLAKALRWMSDEAIRDMEGEGLDLSTVEAEIEMVLFNPKERAKLLQATAAWNISDTVPTAAIDRCLKESDLNADISDLTVELLRLRVKATLPKIEPAQLPVKGEDPSAALKGEREVWRGTEKVTSKVYEWDKLETGNVITGHALIEGTDTTYVVPRGWEFKLDAFRNGVLTRRA